MSIYLGNQKIYPSGYGDNGGMLVSRILCRNGGDVGQMGASLTCHYNLFVDTFICDGSYHWDLDKTCKYCLDLYDIKDTNKVRVQFTAQTDASSIWSFPETYATYSTADGDIHFPDCVSTTASGDDHYNIGIKSGVLEGEVDVEIEYDGTHNLLVIAYDGSYPITVTKIS